MIAKYTGLGFFLGWLWLFLMHGPLLYESAALVGMNADILFCVFLGLHSISYLVILIAEKLINCFKTKLIISALGSGLVTCTTLFICFYPNEIFSSFHYLFYGALLLCGLGSAMLLVIWGEFFSTLAIKQASLYYIGSILTGTALFFIIMALEYEKAVVTVSLLPLVSMFFLFLSLKQSFKQESTLLVDKIFPFEAKLLWMLFIFYLVGGSFYRIIYLSSTYPAPGSYWLTNLIYCTVTIAAGIAIAFFHKNKIITLFKPTLLLLGAGFILFPLCFKEYDLIPFTLFQSGFAFFDIFVWLLFTEIAKQKKPFRVFAVGYFLVTFSILLGEIFFTHIISFFPEADQLDTISLSAALIMFLAALAFNEKRTSNSLSNSTSGSAENSISLEVPPIIDESSLSPDKTLPDSPFSNTKEQSEPSLEDFLAPYNLTSREVEIVTLLLQGRNNPYIRESLNISPNTLKTHLRNIFRKFSISNRQELLSLFNKE